MKKNTKAALAALAFVSALALAQPAAAAGVRIDGNGVWAEILAFFGVEETDRGFGIDPNG
jgi:hypothetical protein